MARLVDSWPSLLALFLPFALCAAPTHTSYYWSTRSLECRNIAGNTTRCALRKPGMVSELNPGCFEELDQKNNTRIYCRIMCEEADETTVLTKTPAWNHRCVDYFTYHLERRRRDWYLWRSGSCIHTTVSFSVRCGLPRDPRVFYRENQQLFEYEDAEPSSPVPRKIKKPF